MLLAAANLPRRLLKKQSWDKNEIALAAAMDVFGDQLVYAAVQRSGSEQRLRALAKQQLARIELLEGNEELKLRERCAGLWELMQKTP